MINNKLFLLEAVNLNFLINPNFAEMVFENSKPENAESFVVKNILSENDDSLSPFLLENKKEIKRMFKELKQEFIKDIKLESIKIFRAYKNHNNSKLITETAKNNFNFHEFMIEFSQAKNEKTLIKEMKNINFNKLIAILENKDEKTSEEKTGPADTGAKELVTRTAMQAAKNPSGKWYQGFWKSLGEKWKNVKESAKLMFGSLFPMISAILSTAFSLKTKNEKMTPEQAIEEFQKSITGVDKQVDAKQREMLPGARKESSPKQNMFERGILTMLLKFFKRLMRNPQSSGSTSTSLLGRIGNIFGNVLDQPTATTSENIEKKENILSENVGDILVGSGLTALGAITGWGYVALGAYILVRWIMSILKGGGKVYSVMPRSDEILSGFLNRTKEQLATGTSGEAGVTQQTQQGLGQALQPGGVSGLAPTTPVEEVIPLFTDETGDTFNENYFDSAQNKNVKLIVDSLSAFILKIIKDKITEHINNSSIPVKEIQNQPDAAQYESLKKEIEEKLAEDFKNLGTDNDILTKRQTTAKGLTYFNLSPDVEDHVSNSLVNTPAELQDLINKEIIKGTATTSALNIAIQAEINNLLIIDPNDKLSKWFKGILEKADKERQDIIDTKGMQTAASFGPTSAGTPSVSPIGPVNIKTPSFLSRLFSGSGKARAVDFSTVLNFPIEWTDRNGATKNYDIKDKTSYKQFVDDVLKDIEENIKTVSNGSLPREWNSYKYQMATETVNRLIQHYFDTKVWGKFKNVQINEELLRKNKKLNKLLLA